MGRYERVAALAGIDRPGLQVADLGCGAGRGVRALLAIDPPAAVVHAIDVTSELDDHLLADARVVSRMADLTQRLPLPDASLDRIVSLNLAEHLADPAAHVADCWRLLRPGGRLVLAHSDWDTALFTASDDSLTRELIDRFVALVPQGADRADGFMGRKLLALAADSAFTIETVSSWADPHRRFDPGSLAWKVSHNVCAAVQDDERLALAGTGWLKDLQGHADAGTFLFTVTDVAVVLAKA